MEAVRSFLKKYSALLPSAVLFLACIIVFIFVMLFNNGLRAEIDKRVKVASEVRSLVSHVPSRGQPEVEKNCQESHSSDAEAVEAMATATSQRELICYSPVIFPAPKETTSQIYLEFGKKYRQAIEGLMSAISAMDAPGEQEIRSKIGTAILQSGPYGGMTAASQSSSQNARVDALCLARAEKIPVYANPSLLKWYSFWENYQFKSTDLALEDSWYSQAAYWIYEDIISTIRVMNEGSSKVSDSAVKRLLGVSFSGPVQVQSAGSSDYSANPEYMYMAGGAGAANADYPSYVQQQSGSLFVASPWTGRVCDDQIDVVHFAVSVVLDSRSVLGFMRQLCSGKKHTYRENFAANGRQQTALHNQITILQNDIEPVLRETDAIHAYYRYGNAPVVRLNLVCEYLFYRSGYDAIKPEVIKKKLNQVPTDQSQAGQPGQ